MSIIDTQKIFRSFKLGSEKIYALKDVTISIEPGKLSILRGRSGSGKTTLINILGAIDTPDTGKVFFNRNDITSMPYGERDKLRRKEMGFVFQSGGLLYDMSAYENVEFGLRIAGYERIKIKKRVEECLSIVGLNKRMDHMPGELSGGEQQRVAIARAIAGNPKVIFADEPTAALDTSMGLTIVKIFKELVQSQGLTVVMSTHDPGMMEIADCVFTLQDGEIVNG